jgi:tRNA-modifying protein YgfZ
MSLLLDRSIIGVSGPDAADFLQNLITQDVTTIRARAARFAALLTPQGKYLSSFFVVAQPDGFDGFLLDVAASEAAMLLKRLIMYRLRSKVTIEDLSAKYRVMAFPADTCLLELSCVAYSHDPRLPALGSRAIVRTEIFDGDESEADEYRARQLALGVPELSRDLEAEKDFALEGLLDELNAIDFHKGCYVGQEMTSRMKRRTTVKQKLCPVIFDGDLPAFNTAILAGDLEVGKMRSGISGRAMALIRFDRANAAAEAGIPLRADGKLLTLDSPGWIIQP